MTPPPMAVLDVPLPIDWLVVVLGKEEQAKFCGPHLKKAVVVALLGLTEPLRVGVTAGAATAE